MSQKMGQSKSETNNQQQKQRYYAISAVAAMMDTHPQTLRMYERLGLIRPRRNRFNVRLYCDEDVERVRRIQHLTQDMGVNLAGVEIIFKLMDRIAELEKSLKPKKRAMQKEVERRAKILALQMFDRMWNKVSVQRGIQIQPLPKGALMRLEDFESDAWWEEMFRDMGMGLEANTDEDG